jgi:hypothetical protein
MFAMRPLCSLISATALALVVPALAFARSEQADWTFQFNPAPSATSQDGGTVTYQATSEGATISWWVENGGDTLDVTCSTAPDLPSPPSESDRTWTAVFPLGTWTVTCVEDGEATPDTSSFTVEVVDPPPPPSSSPPPPAPPPPLPGADVTPPGAVTSPYASTGSRIVKLFWLLPADSDLDHVEVVRTSKGAPPTTVYRGSGTAFVDRSVLNRIWYRYTITSQDGSGNVSPAVVLVGRPRASGLLSPLHGARLVTPPTLRWIAKRYASYYNVQIWRDGTKILSRWPTRARFTLRAGWTYAGNSYRLTPGTYTWYVWPGFGRRATATYGRRLGSRMFVVVAS